MKHEDTCNLQIVKMRAIKKKGSDKYYAELQRKPLHIDS